MGEKPRQKNDEDFRDAIKDVRPLKQDRVAPFRRRRKPTPEQKRLDEQAVLDSLLAESIAGDDIETGEELLFARPGIQHGVMRKLRRGEYVVEGQLDLHG